MMATDNGERRQMDPRRLALQAVLMLGALALAVGVAGAVFEPHLAAGSEWIGRALGAEGMLAFVLLADAVVSPLSPDLLLVVIAHGPMAESSHWLVPALGVMSMLGGLAGALLVRRLGTRLLGRCETGSSVVSHGPSEPPA